MKKKKSFNIILMNPDYYCSLSLSLYVSLFMLNLINNTSLSLSLPLLYFTHLLSIIKISPSHNQILWFKLFFFSNEMTCIISDLEDGVDINGFIFGQLIRNHFKPLLLSSTPFILLKNPWFGKHTTNYCYRGFKF